MTYSLYLAHINDTHSHFEPTLVHFDVTIEQKAYQVDAYCGGYARLATAVQQHKALAKENNSASLFLHAGDSFQGSLYFSQFKGEANAHLLNLMSVDAMTIGNHEFDLGNAPVSKFVDQVNFPCLAGNMDLSQEDQQKHLPLAPHKNLYYYNNQLAIANYVLKPLGEKQLAIVGITHDQMHNIGCPDADCHFLNAIETTKATVKHLNQQGVNHIIILSHLGYEGDIALAKAVTGISVIVGGHSHTLTGEFGHLGQACTGNEGQWQNDCLILQAGKHAESIGLSCLHFDKSGKVIKLDGGTQFLIDDNWQAKQNGQVVCEQTRAQISEYLATAAGLLKCPDDQQIAEIINQQYRPVVEQMKSQVVTKLSHPLRHSRMPNQELPNGSEVSPLVCQGFYQASAAQHPTDFALHNAGGVRVSLKAGPLSKADICGRLLPFEITLMSYLLKGEDLAMVIEGAINNATNNGLMGTGDGSFPYFYKLRYRYHADKALGQRVSQIELEDEEGWQVLQPQRVYRGVSSAYTLAGKEGYDALLNSWDHHDLELSMSDSFVSFASSKEYLL
ncbi:bifunctional UDP-sugar hydrolase/5'-nucleotidase [Agarivorans aestuarii]|uniref:Bifunctional UDP-sugar hydrolase/5'-nucleotidase n=1 Tax=Agarivorans aestuarii TaxID=1563703 RepID=A0ABU7G8X0_9ALTE|nr:bifunctional UDP-sugar hydrolase/5'-nucleotidase [Agarivorans aestuarii]MEE1675796.1 bifunctional UDP-sugar hydrolase/5'-nucleotidase [Agarivorans aestuarii]